MKVKEELRVMREERTKKENAYRLMQRESKQCDIVQKELLKLKESKVRIKLKEIKEEEKRTFSSWKD